MKSAVIDFLLSHYQGTPHLYLEQMEGQLGTMTLDQIAERFLEVVRMQGC